MNSPKQNVWLEDLNGCPSQCYYYFQHSDKRFCILLRWRHTDPWTARLVTLKENWDFSFTDDECSILLNKEYREEEYKTLETDVLEFVKRMYSLA